MKKVVIIVVALLLVVAIGIGAFFLIKNLASKDNDKDNGKDINADYDAEKIVEVTEDNKTDIFSIAVCETLEDIEFIAKQNDLQIFQQDNMYFIGNLNYEGFLMTITFTVDKDGLVTGTQGGFITEEPLPADLTAETLKEYFNKFPNLAGAIFDIYVTENYYNYYATEGYRLNKDEAETYEKLLNEEAFLAMYVKDESDTFWRFESMFIEGSLVFSYTRIFDEEIVNNMPADIILNSAYPNGVYYEDAVLE